RAPDRRTGIALLRTRIVIKPTLLLAFAFVLVPAPALAQDAGEAANWPLFQSQETLPVRIEAPLSTLMSERSDTEYLEGTFSYTDASGQEVKLDLKLRARG